MSTYYVKNGGNDGASGLSDALAWATIGKADDLDGSQADNSVLLKCGSTWREQYNLSCYGTSGHNFTIGSYDSGAKPKIMGSDQITGWTNYSGYIWRASLAICPGGPADPIPDTNGGVWFINASDGKTKWGTKKASAGACTAEYDWFWGSSYLYCYAATDPDTRYTSVEAAARLFGIVSDWDTHYVTIQGLEVCFTARENISDQYGADYWTIDGNTCHHAGPDPNCSTSWAGDNIYWEGTGYWIKNNLCYEASAHTIQHYATSNASGDIIEYNECYNGYHCNYDTKQAGPGVVLSNQIIRYNISYYTSDYAFPTFTSAGLSFQSDYVDCLDGVHIYGNIFYNVWTYGIYCTYYAKNVEIYNNVIYGRHPSSTFDAWGIAVYSDLTGNKPTNVKVKNNIVAGDFGSGGHGFHLAFIGSIAAAADVDYNCYYLNSGQAETYREDTGIAYHSNDWVAWKTATGFDTHSLWNIDPLLVAPATQDFHIQSGSPCKDTGVNVSLTKDYFDNDIPYNTIPDIGIHEYTPEAGGSNLIRLIKTEIR